MANVIEAKKVHEHAVPIRLVQFFRNMPRHVVIHFSMILATLNLVFIYTLPPPIEVLLTETKKLDVPSARENVSGNNFNHVSSPYITSFPPGLAFSCASHVS